MSKKDYELIAEIFRKNKPNCITQKINWDNLVKAMAESFAQENPRFNKSKFIMFCNKEE